MGWGWVSFIINYAITTITCFFCLRIFAVLESSPPFHSPWHFLKLQLTLWDICHSSVSASFLGDKLTKTNETADASSLDRVTFSGSCYCDSAAWLSVWWQLESTKVQDIGLPCDWIICRGRPALNLGHTFWWKPLETAWKKEAFAYFLLAPLLLSSLSCLLPRHSATSSRSCFLRSPTYTKDQLRPPGLSKWTATSHLIFTKGNSLCWTSQTTPLK